MMVRRDLSVPRPRDDMSCPSMASTPEAASFILKNSCWPTLSSHNHTQYQVRSRLLVNLIKCLLDCSLEVLSGRLIGRWVWEGMKVYQLTNLHPMRFVLEMLIYLKGVWFAKKSQSILVKKCLLISFLIRSNSFLL